MYKGMNRFMTSGPGRDTGMSFHAAHWPLKPTQQELLVAAGMGVRNEEEFMARIQGELRKLVKAGIKNPRLQADRLNKLHIFTANGGKWDTARIITFYERQKTRLTHSGLNRAKPKATTLAPENPVLKPKISVTLKGLP